MLCYSLQYMVREHLVEEGSSYQEKAGHGFLSKISIMYSTKIT